VASPFLFKICITQTVRFWFPKKDVSRRKGTGLNTHAFSFSMPFYSFFPYLLPDSAEYSFLGLSRGLFLSLFS
jgi:hypothetical protein